ncbi:MAG: precorrin-8X methylmutase [Syntrophobacteraceae bacterium]|nr:precorrin-8X methylmutase [Syntrophobacteraceae bacterium]
MKDSPKHSKKDRPGLVQAGRRIEIESFRIIEEEMKDRSFPPDQWEVVRRVIHATGDFDYARRIRFHPEAMDAGIEAIRRGASLFVDTRMIHAGLSPWRLMWFGNEVVIPVLHPESHQWGLAMGTTRSAAAFRTLSRRMDGNIVTIGNAPTALLEVVRLIREEGLKPALVIGVPVGFVQAEESKEALSGLPGRPNITVSGRKGGSAVAVAILHALLELAKHARKEKALE